MAPSTTKFQVPDTPRLRWVRLGVVTLSLFLSGFCGIISELSLFNLAETLLGGTNENLTYTMGFMMFAMGVGSALSAHRWLASASVGAFILIELGISLLAMWSVPMIHGLAGLWPGSAGWLIWVFSPMLGLLIGLEIPVALHLNARFGVALRPNAALVLAPDYFGALAAFVLFAFVMLPELGLGHAAWLGGVLNLLVAGGVLMAFAPLLPRRGVWWGAFTLCGLMAGTLGWGMTPLLQRADALHYRDPIVYSEESAYQQLVLTRGWRDGSNAAEGGNNTDAGKAPTAAAPPLRALATTDRAVLARHTSTSSGRAANPALCKEDLRLYIDGGLQLSTCDAHRYHEMLVHPAAWLAGLADRQGIPERPPRALVLGGGDGLAVRELLKYPAVQVDLVDLDEAVVALFRAPSPYADINGGALENPRVLVHIGDAANFLREAPRVYDLVLLDFPDPHRTATARLYSTQFFRLVGQVLRPGGVVATQSFSPLYQPRAFAMVGKTLRAAGFAALPLHVPMLSFEHWGFWAGVPAGGAGPKMAAEAALRARLEAFAPHVPHRYLNGEAMQAALRFSHEQWRGQEDVPVNDQFTLPLIQAYNRNLAPLTRPTP